MNYTYLLKLLRTNKESQKILKSVANLVTDVITPRTKGVGTFLPHTSRLSVREQLGLSKGAYGSLNKYQKQALEDYAYYVLSGKNRNKFIWNPKDKKYRFGRVVQGYETPGVKHIAEDPKATIRDVFVRTGDQKLAFYPTFQQGRVNITPGIHGELIARPVSTRQKDIILTSPKVDYIDSGGNDSKTIAKLSDRIPKEYIREFWDLVQQTTKPGTYLSGDTGRMPLGGYLLQAKTPSEVARVLLADVADASTKSTRGGLSPDSYKAIVKQGLRPEHRLRFSRDGFTVLNSSAVDNKALYEQWKAAKTPQLKQKFISDWNEQIYPRSAFINEAGQIEFLHPFAYYMKKGGNL